MGTPMGPSDFKRVRETDGKSAEGKRAVAKEGGVAHARPPGKTTHAQTCTHTREQVHVHVHTRLMNVLIRAHIVRTRVLLRVRSSPIFPSAERQGLLKSGLPPPSGCPSGPAGPPRGCRNTPNGSTGRAIEKGRDIDR